MLSTSRARNSSERRSIQWRSSTTSSRGRRRLPVRHIVSRVSKVRCLTASGAEVVGRPVVAETHHLQQQGHAGARVDPQLGEPEGGLGLDLGGRVAVRDAAVGAHDVGQRDVGDGRAVGEAAPLQHGEALGGQRAAQLGDDARLAHAGLGDDAHDLAAAGGGLGHQLLKGGELALASDEASSGRRAEALQGRAPRPEPQHAVRDHGLGPAADRRRGRSARSGRTRPPAGRSRR